MKLKELIDTASNIAPSELIACHLCHGTIPYRFAVKDAWVIDLDGQVYYCPECKHFLVNKLDETFFSRFNYWPLLLGALVIMAFLLISARKK